MAIGPAGLAESSRYASPDKALKRMRYSAESGPSECNFCDRRSSAAPQQG
jgi:hypothetical protein